MAKKDEHEKKYEKLRDHGVSREKAGREASYDDLNASGYENLTHSELMARAKEIGISGYNEMTMDELIRALRKG